MADPKKRTPRCAQLAAKIAAAEKHLAKLKEHYRQAKDAEEAKAKARETKLTAKQEREGAKLRAKHERERKAAGVNKRCTAPTPRPPRRKASKKAAKKGAKAEEKSAHARRRKAGLDRAAALAAVVGGLSDRQDTPEFQWAAEGAVSELERIPPDDAFDIVCELAHSCGDRWSHRLANMIREVNPTSLATRRWANAIARLRPEALANSRGARPAITTGPVGR